MLPIIVLMSPITVLVLPIIVTVLRTYVSVHGGMNYHISIEEALEGVSNAGWPQLQTAK